jgi:hypothetical protein
VELKLIIRLEFPEHIAPSVRACRGSIYRTRNDGRHKCRPYKDLKRKFLYYQIIEISKFFMTVDLSH